MQSQLDSEPPEGTGIIYFLAGTKHAARLVVSLHTLRKHYQGAICILTTDQPAAELAGLLADDPRLGVAHRSLDLELGGKRRACYLFKTSLHEFTPFQKTLYLDCDTLITGDISPLFELPAEDQIVVTQFCDWRTRGRTISKRIRSWTDTHPELVEPALAFGPAVNSGVFTFTPRSAILSQWAAVATAGRHHFIPDELALQLLLPHYPHLLLDGRFNCSIQHGQPADPDTRIVHCHGGKHLTRGCDLWRLAYQEAESLNLGNISHWTPAGDQTLAAHLKMADPAARE